MLNSAMSVVILAAGKGTRMYSCLLYTSQAELGASGGTVGYRSRNAAGRALL